LALAAFDVFDLPALAAEFKVAGQAGLVFSKLKFWESLKFLIFQRRYLTISLDMIIS
jgi:hypothetical protein